MSGPETRPDVTRAVEESLPESWRGLQSSAKTAQAIAADLARRSPKPTSEELDLIKRTVAIDATDDELKLYLYDCARQGVHPLDKLIHFTKRGNPKRYTPITSIDFMRMRAADSGEYAGSDDAIFGDIMSAKYPVSATVTVWRLVQGQRCAFTATARWSEYKPDQAFMWGKMPFTMLAKCAEALALRKGFPRQLAGLYAKEEMDQAERGQAALATRDVRTSGPRPQGLSRTTTSGKDRLTENLGPSMVGQVDANAGIIAEVSAGMHGANFQVTLSSGVAFLCYNPKLRMVAEQAQRLGQRVQVATKRSSGGNVYLTGIIVTDDTSPAPEPAMPHELEGSPPERDDDIAF